MKHRKLHQRVDALNHQVARDLDSLAANDLLPVSADNWLTRQRAPVLCVLALAGGYLTGRHLDTSRIRPHKVLAPLVAGGPPVIG